MKSKELSTLACLLSGALFTSQSATAGDHVIIVKGGSYTLENTNQVISAFPSTVTAVFEEDDDTLAIEYDHVFSNGVSIGGGYQAFSLSYTSNAGAGDVDASFFMFNSKYHFSNSNFKPFIGASAGVALTDFNGAVIGNTIGFAVAGTAGFRWQFSTVGIYAEYKNYFSADTEDSLDAEVDLAGESITGGISISF